MILLIIMITQLHYKKAFENFLKRHSASWEAKMLVVQWRHHARIHFGYHTDIYRAHFHHTRNEKRPDKMAPDTSAFASSDIGIKNSITEENWRFNQSWFASLVYPLVPPLCRHQVCHWSLYLPYFFFRNIGKFLWY